MADAAAIASLTAALQRSRRAAVFTGAGVSTESGIPDFRSPGGLWTRYDPRDFTFDRYVDDPEVRALSWQMRRELWAAQPNPNPAHDALAALERAGRLLGVVTQNIDGLHQAAGSQRVLEIHGTTAEVVCIGARPRAGTPEGCGWRQPSSWAVAALDHGDEDPVCPDCGGLVKAATISFGQQLDPSVLQASAELVEACDLLLTIGSSLQVYPAAGLPELAAAQGIPVVIVNDEPTPLDHLASAVVRGRAGEVLPPAVAAVS
jgi:NAD-dependent deacetylase